MLIFFRCRQMRPQAVTRPSYISRHSTCGGCGTCTDVSKIQETEDIVNRQSDDTATLAHFVRYRTNSTLSSLSSTIYAGASDWVGANDHQDNRREA